MLSVILKILSILGIILLVLLGLILVTLLLILFFPIFYRIKADRTRIEDSFDFAMHAQVKANWLFGLLRVRYQYPDPGILQVKLLFFTIYESQKATETASADQARAEDKDRSVSNKKQQTEASAKQSATQASKTQKPTSTDSATNAISDKDKEAAADIPSEKMGLFDKIQYTIQNICDKIKGILDKIRDIRENIEYYREILLCEDTKALLKHAFVRLGKILKSIRPRKLRANIRFGAASPDTTGYVCAAYGILCSYLGKHVCFTPDFEQSVLSGDIYAAGHITVFKILWNVLMVVKDRRLWELKDKLTRKK